MSQKYVIQSTRRGRKHGWYYSGPCPFCGLVPRVKDAGVYNEHTVSAVGGVLKQSTHTVGKPRMIPWETALRRAHGTA